MSADCAADCALAVYVIMSACIGAGSTYCILEGVDANLVTYEASACNPVVLAIDVADITMSVCKLVCTCEVTYCADSVFIGMLTLLLAGTALSVNPVMLAYK